MQSISSVTYGDIFLKIKALEYQMAVINQIFSNKKYVCLTKEFQEEGIIIISDSEKKDGIVVDLIK